MAEMTTQNFQKKIRDALVAGFNAAGIRATIRMEKIPGTKLTRVMVTSSTFRNLRHSERQDLVWRIISQYFKPEEQLRISTIMTLATNEYAAA